MREKLTKCGTLRLSFLGILLICSLLLVSPTYLLGIFSSVVADEATMIPEQHFFKDEKGNLNIAGVVKNNGSVPVQVVVGLNVTASETYQVVSNMQKTIQNTTYGRIVYPSAVSPFKFVVPSNNSIVSEAYVVDVKEIPVPLYDSLVLNYSNVAVGENKALVGTVKNVGSLDLHDVSIYASVHNKNRAQIDSVKSNLIPVIESGKELPFNAIPDPSVRDEVEYFSCAGVDFDGPITTLKIDDDKFVPYNLQAIAKISSLEYVNSTDSISFGVKHYNPEGGDLSLKVPQVSENQSMFVKMDDEVYDKASISMDGKTIHIDLFIPPGDHEMNIQGIMDKM
jgi:hypothetical protein